MSEPTTAREECNRVDEDTIARLKKAFSEDYCRCEEKCPCCGKKKKATPTYGYGPPYYWAPYYPYYGPQRVWL